MLERYRQTMGVDVLHSWAKDAQRKLDAQDAILAELRKTLSQSYFMTPEGVAYLERMDLVMRS